MSATTGTTWGEAEGVLEPANLKMLEASLSQAGKSLVDGWAASNQAMLKRMESDGTLLEQAKAAEEQADDAHLKAKLAHGGKEPPLSAWEMNELYGGPSSCLPPEPSPRTSD